MAALGAAVGFAQGKADQGEDGQRFAEEGDGAFHGQAAMVSVLSAVCVVRGRDKAAIRRSVSAARITCPA